jgi:hypothetical protein
MTKKSRTMEQFYVFANSEDSPNIVNDNAGRRFRVYFPNPYVLNGTWRCALLEVTFVSKLTTPTRRIYVCCDFVENSYVRDSYIPVLQSLSVLSEDVTDVTFENPIYDPVRGGTSKYPWETTTSKYAVLKTITCFVSSISAESSGPTSPWKRRHGRWWASTQEKKSGYWDDQSPDRKLFKGRPCAAPTNYRPTWESGPARSSSIWTRATIAEVTGWRYTSPRGTRRIFRFAEKCTGNVSPPFRHRPDRQRTAILLLFVSNPTQRHRLLRTVLPVLLQKETPRSGTAGHSEGLFPRWFKRKWGPNFKI